LAQQPVSEEIRVFRGKDYLVENEVFEQKGDNGTHYNGYNRPYYMPSQLFQVLKKRHFTLSLTTFFLTANHQPCLILKPVKMLNLTFPNNTLF
jgi:hypothetical protein